MAEMIKSNGIKKKRKINTLRFESILVLALFFGLIIAEMFFDGSYLDDIIGLAAAIYLIFFRNKIDRRDMITIVILFAVTVIGFISNLISNIIPSWTSVVIDIISETKLLFSFYGLKYFLTTEEKQKVIDILLLFAKLFALVTFACAMLNLVTDIGMSEAERYGIRDFKFIFLHPVQYVDTYMFVTAIFVFTARLNKFQRYFYLVISIISNLLSTKSPPVVLAIIFIGLALYYRKHDKVNPLVIIVGFVLLVLVSQYQIDTYLLEESAPRRLFIEYSAKTANTYFPFGAGFSTYGSSEAAKNYSVLYYRYGFDKMYMMGPSNGQFLSDTFWPMAIGQFGWIGAALYILVYIRTYLSIAQYGSQLDNVKRAFLHAMFLQYMIHSIGAAVLSSSYGMIGFMAMGLLVIPDHQQKKRPTRLNIHW